jgi:hypothetical protein
MVIDSATSARLLSKNDITSTSSSSTVAWCLVLTSPLKSLHAQVFWGLPSVPTFVGGRKKEEK